jgi:hypothetical protein
MDKFHKRTAVVASFLEDVAAVINGMAQLLTSFCRLMNELDKALTDKRIAMEKAMIEERVAGDKAAQTAD